MSNREAADILPDVAGRPIVYQNPSPEDVRSLLSNYGWESADVDHILGLFDEVRAGESAAVTPTLGQLLGREPTIFERLGGHLAPRGPHGSLASRPDRDGRARATAPVRVIVRTGARCHTCAWPAPDLVI